MDAGADGIAQSEAIILRYSGKDIPPQYMNYIFGKWKRSLRHGNEYFRLINNRAFNDAYDLYVCSVLLRPDSILRLAVLSDDHDIALGWSVVEKSTLHYVFVQSEYRGMGLAKKLVPDPIDCFTHLTKMALTLWNKKAPNAQFNPFA